MKFSKSILIFLFLSSTLSAFYYGLKRTDGNICKSIIFTMYFLAIKIGLIAPNVPLKLGHHQPNPQLVSRIQTGAVYNPYVSVLDNYRGSGLYMDKIEHPVPQHYVSYHSQLIIGELRAGDSRVTQAAWLLITIWMLQHQTGGFQPVRQAPPHIESTRNLLFGKPKSDSFSSRQDRSIFQTQLDMGRSRRRRSVRQINMDEEYQKFLLIKHPETNCSQERFESLCTDPQRNIITDASIKETIIILECEGRGIVQGVERPDLDNGEPNLDFKVNGPGNYRYADVKEPRNYGRGNQDLDSAARNMGYKIHKQKDQSEYSISRKKILHIVNFELLDPGERQEFKQNIFSPHGFEDITTIDINKRN